MIFGIGHDIVENSRIAKLHDDYQINFAKKILTRLELVVYSNKKDKVQFLAKRFAAKEAFAKACQTGLRNPVTLHNIGILNNQLGKPYFYFTNELSAWLKTKNITNAHLSISDEATISSAFVILESN